MATTMVAMETNFEVIDSGCNNNNIREEIWDGGFGDLRERERGEWNSEEGVNYVREGVRVLDSFQYIQEYVSLKFFCEG